MGMAALLCAFSSFLNSFLFVSVYVRILRGAEQCYGLPV